MGQQQSPTVISFPLLFLQNEQIQEKKNKSEIRSFPPNNKRTK